MSIALILILQRPMTINTTQLIARGLGKLTYAVIELSAANV